MPIDILVPLTTYPDPIDQSAFGPLVDFIDVLEPSITAVPIEVDIPSVANPVPLGEGVASRARQAEAESREVVRELSTRLRELTERAGVRAVVEPLRSQPQTIAETIATLARTHDLTAIIYDPEIADTRVMAEATMFSSGGPVLLFPARLLQSLKPEVVAIAWDGSRSASRALHDARPWLAQAQKVVVLAVTDDKELPPQWDDELLAYLGRMGLRADSATASLQGRSVGEALQKLALAHEATLLVMGAFGHNRVREFLLGGATRSVLDKPLLPVLLSY